VAIPATNTFWYRLLDVIHYAALNVEIPVSGFVCFTKHDWALCFYRDDPSTSSDRAWERWKGTAREEGLIVPPPPGQEATRTSEVRYCIWLPVRAANDAVYRALGAPHPGGLFAQIEYEDDLREQLMPKVLRGIAAAARVEQRRRQAG